MVITDMNEYQRQYRLKNIEELREKDRERKRKQRLNYMLKGEKKPQSWSSELHKEYNKQKRFINIEETREKERNNKRELRLREKTNPLYKLNPYIFLIESYK